jgi:ubiquinone/menaquinone biosynthesis C-methylase UbiE
MSRHQQLTGGDLREWERAEIERSGIEANLTPQDELLADEANVARYLTPPETTPYPLEYAFHLLGDIRGKTVVDLGCGSGINSLLLARRGAKVIGVDISESLLRMALKRATVNQLESTHFVASSAHDLSLKEESADVVLGIAILHHLDLRLIADETWRLLKMGGRAIFQEPIRNSPVLRVLRRAVPYRAPDVSPFERPLLDEEIAAFASRFSGWRRSRVFCLPFVNVASIIGVSRPHLHRLYQYDARLLQKLPRLAKYGTVRVIEVTK